MTDKLVDALANVEDEDVAIARGYLEEAGDATESWNSLARLWTWWASAAAGKYFCPNLLMAGEMLSRIADIVSPNCRAMPLSKAGARC